MAPSEVKHSKYDPISYWNNREHPNTAADPGLNPHEVAFLYKWLNGAESVLEIGPGVGRLFPMYKLVPTVATVDLSTNYRTRARAAASSAGILVNDFYLSDARQKLPFKDREFSLGIVSHMFMHVPFDLIEHSMSEAARCCRTVAVISAKHVAWPRKGQAFDPQWHCFTHDYEAICDAKGWSYGGYQLFVEREKDGAFGFVFSADPKAKLARSS